LNILKTLQKAERTLEKEAHKIGLELDGLRNAMAALGHKVVKTTKPKSRLSAKARARISAAQKKRWAAVRAKKKTS
jgi:hypothetical protein